MENLAENWEKGRESMITHRTEITVEVPIIITWFEDMLIPENKKFTVIEDYYMHKSKFNEMYPDEKLIEMIKEEESLCPECDSKVINGVCQGACKSRLL